MSDSTGTDPSPDVETEEDQESNSVPSEIVNEDEHGDEHEVNLSEIIDDSSYEELDNNPVHEWKQRYIKELNHKDTADKTRPYENNEVYKHRKVVILPAFDEGTYLFSDVLCKYSITL